MLHLYLTSYKILLLDNVYLTRSLYTNISALFLHAKPAIIWTERERAS
jgi:hypothetical protein